jgi:3'(2'), 5'-bisphosphate nucleotidase
MLVTHDLGPDTRAEIMEGFVEAVSRAGAIILAHRVAGCAVETKADHSPVTVADQESEAEILTQVRRVLGDVPVVAEESISAGLPDFDPSKPFVVIDPLDGTKEFIEGRAEFTVNLALIVDRKPFVGVIYAPALETLYAGCRGEAFGGWLDPGETLAALRGRRVLQCRAPDPEKIVAVAPIASIAARQSSCVLSPRGRPISTPASGRLASGTRQRATPSSKPQAVH